MEKKKRVDDTNACLLQFELWFFSLLSLQFHPSSSFIQRRLLSPSPQSELESVYQI